MKQFSILLILFLTVACTENKEISYKTEEVHMITLTNRFTNAVMEFSGMDWYGDTLFMLSQIPSVHNDSIFFSTREELQNYFDNKIDSLTFHGISFIDDGVKEKINKEPDYEAIAFNGDSVYLLIETERPMRSYIIQGIKTKKSITLISESLTEIVLKYDIFEIACEALFIYDNKIYVFYEANGSNIDSDPQVFCFDLSLNMLKPVGFDHIEYRITDATKITDENSFWIINHFWQGEMDLLKPAEEKFIPSTYKKNNIGVNRLINLYMAGDEIRIKNYHPLMLPPRGWNWEALASFNKNTFLIINDEFSVTPHRTGFGYIVISKDE